MNRNNIKIALAILACVIVAIITAWMGMKGRSSAMVQLIRTDTLVVRDTVVIRSPAARDSTLIRTVYIRAKAVHDTVYATAQAADTTCQDSLTIALELEQKRYETEDYRAWVSGYMASLDSVEFYPQTRIITNSIKTQRKPWSLGVNAGYAVTTRGLAPYIGIGIQYGIFRF